MMQRRLIFRTIQGIGSSPLKRKLGSLWWRLDLRTQNKLFSTKRGTLIKVYMLKREDEATTRDL